MVCILFVDCSYLWIINELRSQLSQPLLLSFLFSFPLDGTVGRPIYNSYSVQASSLASNYLTIYCYSRLPQSFSPHPTTPSPQYTIGHIFIIMCRDGVGVQPPEVTRWHQLVTLVDHSLDELHEYKRLQKSSHRCWSIACLLMFMPSRHFFIFCDKKRLTQCSLRVSALTYAAYLFLDSSVWRWVPFSPSNHLPTTTWDFPSTSSFLVLNR